MSNSSQKRSRGVFRIQSNICDGAFSAKVVNDFYPLIFSQKAPSYMVDWVLITLLKEKPRKGNSELSKQREQLFMAQESANTVNEQICRNFFKLDNF